MQMETYDENDGFQDSDDRHFFSAKVWFNRPKILDPSASSVYYENNYN